MEVEPPIALLRRYPRETLISWRETIWDKLDKMTFEEAEAPLLPTLPPAVRSRIGRDEGDTLRNRVGGNVGAWIDHALEDGETTPAHGMRARESDGLGKSGRDRV